MRHTANREAGPAHPPAIQAKVLRGILNAVDITDSQRTDLLEGEGLSEPDLRGVAATVGLKSYMRIFDRLARMIDEPTLGLDLSGRMGPELVGAIGYVFMHSPSLGAAITALTRSVGSIQGATRLWYERGPFPTLVYAITDDNVAPRRHDVEFSVGYVYALIKSFLGGKFVPREVHFEHARPVKLRKTHEAFFGCPVYFEQERNALVLQREDLRKGSMKSDPNLVALLQHYIQLLGERDHAVTTLTENTIQVLSGLIGTRRANIAHIAARLGMSRETLRRKLKREGTSYRKVVRRKRIAIAKLNLFETDLSVLRVAQKVGYSETASFTRAFSDETGQTPTQYRRGVRGT